ncbi:hypothetical protein [Clostridium sp. C2-6-12]|nr:hypothetical protein [Clostridium sp. C2-6-12]
MKNIVIIIQITILIFELIKEGLSKGEITGIIMNKFDVSKEIVKKLL